MNAVARAARPLLFQLDRASARTELAAAGGVTAAAGLFYWLLGAAALDPPASLDAWYYTAFFRNFDYLYHTFGFTYYASRLPWIIPGYLLHFVLSPVAAFFVLHVAYSLGGAIAAYLLVRRFLGRTVALAAYAGLLGNLIWWDAYATDYPDGAVVTYVLVGTAFSIGSWRARRPALWMGLGGFFLAAAVGTNLFAGWLVLALVVLYAFVFSARPRFLRGLVRDAAAFAGGWLGLLVVCGGFSVAKGGRFLFFMPSVRQVQTQNPADVKAHGYAWLREEPRLLAPLLLVAVAALLWSRRDRERFRTDAALRFAYGSAASLAFLSAVFAAWEFGFTGAFLEAPYYFTMLSPHIVLALAGALSLVLRSGERSRFVPAAAVAASALPGLLLYRWHVGGTRLFAPDALWPIGAVLAASLVLVATSRAVRSGAVALAAVAALLLGVEYAAAGSLSTKVAFSESGTFRQREEATSLALQLIRFVRGNGLQDGVTPPAFWYSAAADSTQNGMQSTYLWGFTQVGTALPRLDPRAIERLHPQYLVLLCAQTGCGAARSALLRHGYRFTPVAARVLRAGAHRVDVEAVALAKFKPIGPLDRYSRFYGFHGAAPVDAAAGAVAADWSFAHGLAEGWDRLNGEPSAAADGTRYVTGSQRLGYQAQGPRIELRPGRYRVVLDARVRAGGLLVGLLDDSRDSWLEQASYWSRQPGLAGRRLGFDVSLPETTTVRLILSNWSDGWPSTWILRDARIVRLGP